MTSSATARDPISPWSEGSPERSEGEKAKSTAENLKVDNLRRE